MTEVHPLAEVYPLDRIDDSTQRRKSVRLSTELIISLLKVPPEGLVIGERRVFPDNDPIPFDAKVMAVRITNRGYVELDIESEEFPETHHGDQLIHLRPTQRIEFMDCKAKEAT